MQPIAVMNESTVISDDKVKSFIPALQTQLSRDFGPAWGKFGQLVWVDIKSTKPSPGAWWLVFLDNSDQAGALAYHDLTDEGKPLSKVFAATDLAYNASISVSASHEIVEMMADPDINLAAFTTRGIYAYEPADPTEDDQFGYDINGVKVSDFVYPAWFEAFANQKYDQCGHVSKPLQLLRGGYISVFGRQGWTEITAEGMPILRSRPPVGSRRERRKLPREHWQRSRRLKMIV